MKDTGLKVIVVIISIFLAAYMLDCTINWMYHGKFKAQHTKDDGGNYRYEIGGG